MAPFFPVTFADFWIADQMNSLAIILLDMEYFICYLVYGQFANPGNGLMDGWRNRWTNGISSKWTDGLINGCNVYGKIDGHLNNG